jgi:Arc/MetJ family transcription regulator
MRTTLNLNEKLLEEVVCISGEKDKGRAVNKAMEEYVRRQKIERLLAARGAFPDLVDNIKELRRLDLERTKKLEW